MGNHFKYYTLIFTILSTLNLSFAGGFQVNLQGTKALMMGHCGTGFTLGSSSQFFNPGAFAFCDSNHLEFNGNLIKSSINYLEPSPGIATTSTVPGIGTPFSFFASFKPKNGKLNTGLAIYTPFGSGIQYPDEWAGKFVIREMALKTIFIQPTAAYQINDQIGIGGGLIVGYGDFLLRKALPIQDLNGTYGEGTLTGKSTGIGYNIGLYLSPMEKLSIGVSYRSSVNVRTDKGSAVFSTPEYLSEFFPNTSFSTTIKLPWKSNFGIAYHLSEKTMIALDLNYVGWSTFDTLGFDFDLNTDKLKDVASARMYNNVLITRIGIQYIFTNQIVVRAGAYYDRTPVEDQYITPETPDVDKLGITAGVGYLIGNKIDVNLAILYINGNPRTAFNAETGFGGTWKSSSIIPSLSIDFAF